MRAKAPIGAIIALACFSTFAQDRPDSCAIGSTEVHQSYRSYHVDGVTLSDGTITISIEDAGGKVIYESRFPVVRSDGRYIEWKYYGEMSYSMSRRVDDATVRTVPGMIASAKDVVRAIRRGRVSATHRPTIEDNYGCDFPFEDLSCTPAGNCCDTHDTCYWAFNCDAVSWLGLESTFCTACNVALVACIVNGTGGNGMPSTCCAAGNCGQPNPTFYFGGFGSGKDGGSEVMDREMVVAMSGGGGSFGDTPWGTIYYGGGNCTFPDGTVIPCS